MNNLIILIVIILLIIVVDIFLFYRLFKKDKNKVNRKFIGFCSVDSGMIMITDPCYIRHFDNSLKNFEIGDCSIKMVDHDKMDQEEEKERKSYSYAGCCAVVDSEDCGGQLYSENDSKEGVCVSTGVGDGIYSVYAIYSDKYRFPVAEAVVIDFFGLIDEEK